MDVLRSLSPPSPLRRVRWPLRSVHRLRYHKEWLLGFVPAPVTIGGEDGRKHEKDTCGRRGWRRLFVVAMGGAASAGEVTGNGEARRWSASSRPGRSAPSPGQNDDPTGGGDPFEDGRVQNWGQVLEDAKALIGDGDNGANELAHKIRSRVRGPTAEASPAAAEETYPGSGRPPSRRGRGSAYRPFSAVVRS